MSLFSRRRLLARVYTSVFTLRLQELALLDAAVPPHLQAERMELLYHRMRWLRRHTCLLVNSFFRMMTMHAEKLSLPNPWSMHLQVPADICQSQGQQVSTSSCRLARALHSSEGRSLAALCASGSLGP